MKKSAKAFVWSILGLILFLCLWTVVTAIQIGWTNGIVQDEWRRVETQWNRGDFFGASSNSLQAAWMTIDCGIRTTISQPYFRRSVILESRGQFKQAFDVCLTGARFIGPYDPEGAIGYQCVALEMRHHILFPVTNSPTPVLTPVIEP